MSGKDQCFTHDPEVAQRRQRSKVKGGKTGGRGRPKVRLDNIYAFAQDQLQGLSDRSVEPRRSAVAVQWCNLQVKVIETERKLIEIAELEQQVEEIKKLYSQSRQDADLGADYQFGGGTWTG